MMRGTTPTHSFVLPIETDTIKTVQIVYRQNGSIKLEKGNDDCTLEGNTVTLKLTQEDTFAFADNACVEVQIRVLTKDGDALASGVKRIRCDECISDEVLA